MVVRIVLVWMNTIANFVINSRKKDFRINEESVSTRTSASKFIKIEKEKILISEPIQQTMRTSWQMWNRWIEVNVKVPKQNEWGNNIKKLCQKFKNQERAHLASRY